MNLARVFAVLVLAVPALAHAFEPARGGVLDLTQAEFIINGIAVMDGEWDFVAGQLVDPAAPWPQAASTPLKVPGSWGSVTKFGYGVGTYRLRVACGAGSTLALSLPFQSAAATFFANGVEVARHGRPGLTPKEHAPEAPRHRTVVLERAACPIELRVHLSNFEFYRAGLQRRMYIGTREDIAQRRDSERLREVAAIAASAVLGLFGLLLAMGRPRDPGAFLFGLYCVCLAFFMGLSGERVLQPFYDGLGLGFETQVRLYIMVVFAWQAILPLLYWQLFPRGVNRALPIALASFCGSGVLLVLVAPISVFTRAAPIAWVSWAIIEVFAITILIRAWSRGERGALLVLVSIVLMTGSLLLDAFPGLVIRFGQALPIGMACVVVALALQIGQRLRRALAAEELRAIEQSQRVDVLVRATKAGVLDWDGPSDTFGVSERLREMVGLPRGSGAVSRKDFRAMLHEDDRDRVAAVFEARMRARGSGLSLWEPLEFRIHGAGGTPMWVQCEAISIFAADGRPLRHVWTFVDISRLKATELKLRDTQGRLVAEARRAGMAQVATNVLHNVGNVLNSVNVSAHVLTDLVRNSRVSRVADVARVVEEGGSDLARFFTEDERGRLLPGYLRELGEVLGQERDTLLGELARLDASVDHIKNVVAMQQSYAGASGLLEKVRIAELLDDALRIQEAALERAQVDVMRDFEPAPALLLDRTRTMQILVNLVENARHALESVPHRRVLRVAVHERPGEVEVRVGDNGCGIALENLSRIFGHGFTTKPGGHGFGLHSCAVAAREMGGSLVAHSDGLGSGALFTLVLRTDAAQAGTVAGRDLATIAPK